LTEAQVTDASWRLAVDALEAALARGETPTLPLPLVGITLLPPWWWLILWAGKRIENRAPSVAGRLRGWRGLIALTSSKPPASEWPIAIMTALDIKASGIGSPWAGPKPWVESMAKERSGCVVGVAELLGVQDNDSAPPDGWAVAGQRGLMLGRVIEVEPVPCSGGRGVFRFGACGGCGKPGAVENKGVPLVCRTCKVTTPFEALGRPNLKVRSVQPMRPAMVTG
jgi:hypothetical protein